MRDILIKENKTFKYYSIFVINKTYFYVVSICECNKQKNKIR